MGATRQNAREVNYNIAFNTYFDRLLLHTNYYHYYYSVWKKGDGEGDWGPVIDLWLH